jgi:drug/metabolite transporter (DMT)-like permease
MKVVVWKTWPRVLAPENRRNFLIWCIGMTMTAGAGILFTEALNKTDKSSIVASLNGIGLIALAFFTMSVLKEKVGGREWGAIGLIIIGTALVQYFNDKGAVEQVYNSTSLFVTLGVSLGTFVLLVLGTKVLNKGRAFVFAAIAGTFLGLMVIFFDIAGVVGEGSAAAKYLNWYWVTGFMCGNGAFVFTNMAFFSGSATMVVPTVNSFMIIMPMIFEYLIFGVNLKPVQYAGAAVIVTGVIILTTGAGHAVSETPEQAKPKPA